MHYYSADYLFDGEQFLPSNAILCVQDDGTIDGIIFDIGELPIIHKEGLICPGFVNAHCHVELSHLKHKINRGIGLVNFIREVNHLRYSESAENKAFSIQTAEEEMIENGIVAVGDIANTMDTFNQKEKKNLHYHTFVECFGLLDEDAQKKCR
jgi:cytosine/adenosine deaminase-related metal-dependent hydrolase